MILSLNFANKNNYENPTHSFSHWNCGLYFMGAATGDQPEVRKPKTVL